MNLHGGNGFDQKYWIIEKVTENSVLSSCKTTLYAQESGIELKIFSNQPVLVVYTPKQFPNMSFKSNFLK